ncbi:MAG: hypothetical protein NW226_05040 [Microscillaceae bacterium]|nr:hypothetical protein [Microscillaceae bacterium]
MTRFEKFVEMLREEVPVEIRFKDESSLMKYLNLFLGKLSPTFMTHFTTTIGYTVYFPSREYVLKKEDLALRILAHEAVHLLDAKKYSKILFSMAYLAPQIFVLGVFSFPWLGYWALLFLVCALPLPSPSRYYLETRGYVMNWITHPLEDAQADLYLKYFIGWDYYKMYPFRKAVIQKLHFWKNKIQKKEDRILNKVLDMYAMINN